MGVRKIFDYLFNLEMARFDLRYSEVLIFKILLTTSTISATERNLSHLSILANALSTSSLVVGRTASARVALQQEKRLVDSPSWWNESTSAFAAT